MEQDQKIRVGVIGCGLICYYHIPSLINKCGPVEIHLCDQNIDTANRVNKAFNAKWPIYTNAVKLLTEDKIDVVHILTPPNSHFELAELALENHIHTFVEKPMSLSFEQTQQLYDLSEKYNLMLCGGHSLLYMPCVQKAFQVIKNELGPVISVNSFFGHSEKGNTIAYGGVSHWIYKTKGGPLANIISHPASVMVELLGGIRNINTFALQRNFMPDGLKDMVTFSIDTDKGFGTCTLTMAHGNASRYINIECEKGTVYIDLSKQLTIIQKKGKLGFISKAFGGIDTGLQSIHGTLSVILQMATKKLKSNPGTHELVRQFYKCLRANEPSPVSKENVLAVAKIFDRVLVNP